MAAAFASSALVLGAVASDAAAAPTPPTPQAATNCFGSMADASTADQLNQLSYKFQCDGRITAYTVIANRRPRDFEVLDNFSTTANVLDNKGQIVSDQSFLCEGTLPGNGVNCNAGPASFVSALNTVQGSLQLADPYCKNLPANPKPGTYAEPQAVVQLVVTDDTGAQSGPFRLSPTSGCPSVPDRVPMPKPKSSKKKTKKGHAGSGRKARASRHA